ncbi:MAG: domain S-box protein [Anaerocolumna sp.]|jgi:PAS domain S-box-containing protein|nr:domain S-box protein [Anaerocolumna sp.]
MSGIILFVPSDKMVDQANKILQEKCYKIEKVKRIQTIDAVNEARNAVSNGASIIIARGMQANLIKSYTKIPVVEITLTGQEMGLLITEAKKKLDKECPIIAVIGVSNMFCDMTYFNQIFEIDLRTYFGDNEEELRGSVNEAINDQVDFIIGGNIAMLEAKQTNIPSLFLESTEDSIRQAFHVAEQLKYVSEVENRNAAQLETLMDYSFNGIIKLDSDGRIVAANHIMEEILGKKAREINGLYVVDVIKEIEQERIEHVLNDGKDIYSTFIRINHNALVVMIAPIVVEDHIEGGILSCHKVKKIDQVESDTLREMYLHGYVAKANFEELPRNSKKMQANIELAKLYAQSNSPVLIEGEVGTEKELFAESIHNNSLRKNGPFISVNCSDMSEETQSNILFGDKDDLTSNIREIGALGTAMHGSVLISEIDQLGMHNQYRLYKALKYKALIQNDIKKLMSLDIRIITTSSKNLFLRMKQQLFREDLYYLLSGLSLEIPPLRERKNDIKDLVEQLIKQNMTIYSRYHILTDEAKKLLIEYDWYGNRIQLESFCERMILTAKSRKIDEIYVKYLLSKMYPIIHEQDNLRKTVIHQDPEAAHIAEVLRKHNGNRTKTAEELDMSKTTLWRYMKKYGISNKYDI